MATKKTGKYVIVENLTGNLLIITADDTDRKEGEIVLQPYDQTAVVGAGWREDVNLRAFQDNGMVRVSDGDRKPAHLPRMPGNLTDPRDRNMVEQIVFSPLHTTDVVAGALDSIPAEPRDANRAGRPINVKWLKERHRPVLQIAAQWLKLLGWPDTDHLDARTKLAAIEKRILEINDLAY